MVDEKYFDRVGNPHNPMDSAEIYINPTSDDFNKLRKLDSHEVRSFIDFAKKKVYIWDGEILHDDILKSGKVTPTLRKTLKGVSRTDYPDELDAEYFDVSGHGYDFQGIGTATAKALAKSDWKWLNKYFTNVEEIKTEFVQSMKR